MSLISIIIPSYNRASLIGQTIESVQAQSYRNWELIIVDDGSTDGSIKVIKSYLQDERINLRNRPPERPAGGNAARNFGFELAQGDYIKWLDSDDLLDPKCLELQKRFLENKNADVVFCRSKEFTDNDNNDGRSLGRFWHPTFPEENEPNDKLLENFIQGKYRFSNNDGLWKKEFFTTSPYNETLKNSQEWLMIIEAFCHKPKVHFLDDVLVFIRKHAEQMPKKRTYGSFVNNQIRARYLAVKKLKTEKMGVQKIYIYLFKSQVYYFISQIKKRNFQNFFQNVYFLFQTLNQIIFK